jgi:acetyltransferase-like isoleucine patch superfamily enzyme
MGLAATHDLTKIGLERQVVARKFGSDIHIGRGTWIGSGAILLGPCSIGANVVIYAGSVVRGDVPENAVASGAPARSIRQIDLRAG